MTFINKRAKESIEMKINKKTKIINEELIKEATLREDEDSNTEVSPDGEVSVTTETENGITTFGFKW